jgi:hypothetical protein
MAIKPNRVQYVQKQQISITIEVQRGVLAEKLYFPRKKF